MIVDLYNEIFTQLKTTHNLNVNPEYDDEAPTFPVVVFKESANLDDEEHKDSSGFNYADLAFEIQIYTDGPSKMTEAKAIRNTVDGLMSGTYGMNRSLAQEVPNYIDRRIYRYVLRYECKANYNKQIFRR